MGYRWADHVGELELHVEAPSREQVFAEALRALADVLGERPAEEAVERRELELPGDDLPVLLADWLGELAFLAETEGFVPASVESIELTPVGLRARVRGSLGDPPHLVKAVTYHRLAFEAAPGGWRAVAVLDV